MTRKITLSVRFGIESGGNPHRILGGHTAFARGVQGWDRGSATGIVPDASPVKTGDRHTTV